MSKRNQLLTIAAVSQGGAMGPRKKVGGVYVDVTDQNGLHLQISAEISHSSGVGAFQRNVNHKNPLINIWTENTPIWTGTIEELIQKLK